ncbi:DUF2460 domain-containing protein [Pelagerythrobacter sp.]|uniref:DUF2460 domain-containing protein n=1 Tax=Pelagerythrobacter sp. TaxID=2800702 RepID=UPI0035B1CD96
MPFWLARERRDQDSDWIQRFDPRFWTVDFPRPMTASVVTTSPDALRVDLEFHHRDALAGLIWASEDTLDHPLLAYATDRDYERTTLRFRWRSSGIVPLDAPHGPTLTIEGRDAAGEPRSWYVRLWNYASGSPEDAAIALPFSAIAGGWDGLGGGGNEAVYPRDIERMFVSLVPPGYDPADPALLPARANGWAEMSGIRCEGHRAMIAIGDVMLPEHGTGMCTAYDDSYNQTPARLLRTMRGLGYRGAFVHYVGMSHYYRLERTAEGLKAAASATFAAPALAWHRNFLARAVAQGDAPVPSLSYELLAQDCPAGWMQRAHDGSPALTGWSPPSTLLSPCNIAAQNFLRVAMLKLVDLMAQAGARPVFQIGEPWWWVTTDGKICLYDDAAKARFGGDPPIIADVRQPLDAAQKQLLDIAGSELAISTSGIRYRVINAAGPEADVRLLVFTPTVLDPAMPELYRANLPRAWRWPLYDGLQLEDYDWLTTAHDARRRQGYAFVQDRLGYPLERQEYLSGFVLDAGDADAFWRRIDAGLDQARESGVARGYVWAQPQIARDGYVRLPPTEDLSMQAFDDVLYPLALGRDAAVSPEFSTSVAVGASGHERRNSLWSDARLRFDVGPGIRSEAELGALIAFFRARRGAARGFRLADPFDFSSHGMTGTPTAFDQLLGIGDGARDGFALVKAYGEGDEPQVRPITRPRAQTVRVSVDGVETAGWTLAPGGRLLLDHAPPPGAEVRAGFLFDVPVRFAEDRIDVTGANFAAGEAPTVPLIEIREAA